MRQGSGVARQVSRDRGGYFGRVTKHKVPDTFLQIGQADKSSDLRDLSRAIETTRATK